VSSESNVSDQSQTNVLYANVNGVGPLPMLDTVQHVCLGLLSVHIRLLTCGVDGCQAEGCSSPSQEQRNCCEERMLPSRDQVGRDQELTRGADECNEEGCRTIVEGDYPYCVIRKTYLLSLLSVLNLITYTFSHP